MKNWQKYWLYFLIGYSFLHLIRDILQDLGIKVFLSTILVKKPIHPEASFILWTSFNTYVVAIVEIILTAICLKRKYFGKLGVLTILIAFTLVILWLFYWFFL